VESFNQKQLKLLDTSYYRYFSRIETPKFRAKVGYQIDALAVGQELVWDLPIAIVPLGTETGLIDGLIGMDFLGHFNFNIDQGNQELKLTPRQ
jgi:hypothetical protein